MSSIEKAWGQEGDSWCDWAFNCSHFAVLLFDIEAHQVTIYDSLPCRLKKWESHISYLLRKYSLQEYKDMSHVEVAKGTDWEEVLKLGFSDLDEMLWLVSKSWQWNQLWTDM